MHGSRDASRRFPREEIWLVFLIMGFLGSLTIARENIVIVYQGRVSGQHAVIAGYLLAGIAAIGLFRYYRAMQRCMASIAPFSRWFWLAYALCMALPFIFSRLALSRRMEGILLVFSATFIGSLGHIFYSKLKSISQEHLQRPAGD